MSSAPKTPLTGKGSNTSTPRQEVGTPDWSMAEVQEFVPQGFEGAHLVSSFCRSFRNLLTSGGLDHHGFPSKLPLGDLLKPLHTYESRTPHLISKSLQRRVK